MAKSDRFFVKIMSDTDLEEQKYELLALKEIIGEENLKVYVSGSENFEDLEAENSSQFFHQSGSIWHTDGWSVSDLVFVTLRPWLS